MKKIIFEINGLCCKYGNSVDNALVVDHLSVCRGEVVFIVGASGVGKSTILETLGFMNNTMVENWDTKVFFYPEGDQPENMLHLWKKNEQTVSRFRRQFFSFIFQNTNLMPTLTVYENVILPALLQGTQRSEAVKKAKEVLNHIAPDLNGHKKIMEISGGERQRTAFARAITGNFHVLLADEPTGNLDKANASNLMSKLISYLREKNRAAVIVTHDVELAEKHADKIIFIEKIPRKNNRSSFGKICCGNTFEKNGQDTQKWNSVKKGSALSPQELKEYLVKELYTNP